MKSLYSVGSAAAIYLTLLAGTPGFARGGGHGHGGGHAHSGGHAHHSTAHHAAVHHSAASHATHAHVAGHHHGAPNHAFVHNGHAWNHHGSHHGYWGNGYGNGYWGNGYWGGWGNGYVAPNVVVPSNETFFSVEPQTVVVPPSGEVVGRQYGKTLVPPVPPLPAPAASDGIGPSESDGV
jgi:hypothetical protein